MKTSVNLNIAVTADGYKPTVEMRIEDIAVTLCNEPVSTDVEAMASAYATAVECNRLLRHASAAGAAVDRLVSTRARMPLMLVRASNAMMRASAAVLAITANIVAALL
jgi:hypothetical protein